VAYAESAGIGGARAGAARTERWNHGLASAHARMPRNTGAIKRLRYGTIPTSIPGRAGSLSPTGSTGGSLPWTSN
jgi:hypothetical protein